MKAFVIMYNRLTWAKQLCEDLVAGGCEPILIDNQSTYPPLLEWYKTCPYEVHRVPNTGGKSGWDSGVIQSYDEDYYIVTDHDINISEVPKDFVTKLMQGVNNHDTVKAGLSLQLDDLPNNDYANEARRYEATFWEHQSEHGWYHAPVDTTFALYRADKMKSFNFPYDYLAPDFNDVEYGKFFSAVRSPKKYQCKHLPWYNEVGKISDEERYYLNSVKNDGYWSRKFLENENSNNSSNI